MYTDKKIRLKYEHKNKELNCTEKYSKLINESKLNALFN